MAWEATGASLIESAETDGHLDLTGALQSLAQKGLTRILSEGGGTVAAALVRARLVDELAMFAGGVLIGSEGYPALGSLDCRTLSGAPRPHLTVLHTLAPDIFGLWRMS